MDGSSPEQYCLMLFFDFKTLFTAKCVHPTNCQVYTILKVVGLDLKTHSIITHIGSELSAQETVVWREQ